MEFGTFLFIGVSDRKSKVMSIALHTANLLQRECDERLMMALEARLIGSHIPLFRFA
jgi:hypothetical protein